MLATARETLPDSEDYIYEIKLDGQRTMAEIRPESLLLYTRNFQVVTDKYPELKEISQSVRGKPVILDGEIIALKEGLPSFEFLQQRMNLRDPRAIQRAVEKIPIVYYVFDVLEYRGKSLLKKPLEERKKILARIVKPTDYIKIVPYFDSRDFTVETASRYGYEGVIAKKRNSLYYPGERKDCWLKLKFQQYGTFLVCGWQEGSRSQKFGSLLLGKKHGPGQLIYVGKVGTGFKEAVIQEMMKIFSSLQTDQSPYTSSLPITGKIHWLKPQMKARIKYKEWTGSHMLRSPVFLGFEK